jgi:hypothetical protein
MIDYVIGGEYLNVTSNKGAQPYINKTSGLPMTGAMSYDPSTQQMKVYDGSNWLTIGGGQATVNLSPNAISILKWAENKMQEEYELQRLAESNPTIKDLVDQMNNTVLDYQRKIAMVKILIKEEEKIVTS